MKVARLALVALVATATLTSVAGASPDAARQRVSITMQDLPNGKFVLDPLQAGTLKRDSGTTSVVYKRSSVAIREGQRVEIYRLTFTLTGKRGSITTRERNEWVDAGGPFVGNGTWKIVSGTGQYAGVAGGGRTASAGLDRGTGPGTCARKASSQSRSGTTSGQRPRALPAEERKARLRECAEMSLD